jgi:hypothetical protein
MVRGTQRAGHNLHNWSKQMRIQNSTVRQFARMSRPSMFKTIHEEFTPQPITSAKPEPARTMRRATGMPWLKNMVVHRVDTPQMPLLAGIDRRDHRIIVANHAPRIVRDGQTFVFPAVKQTESHVTDKSSQRLGVTNG